MASRVNPFITFSGNTRQAMGAYRSVFGGSLTLTPSVSTAGRTSPYADNIMHAMLETDSGFTLVGADTPPGMEHNPGNNVAVGLSGDDPAELRGYWDKLSDGGAVSVPLEKQADGVV